jgi:hypothetical protein
MGMIARLRYISFAELALSLFRELYSDWRIIEQETDP